MSPGAQRAPAAVPAAFRDGLRGVGVASAVALVAALGRSFGVALDGAGPDGETEGLAAVHAFPYAAAGSADRVSDAAIDARVAAA